MALTKCKECGRDVSDKAGKCPGCGAEISKPTSRITIGIVGLLCIFMVKCAYDASTASPQQKIGIVDYAAPVAAAPKQNSWEYASAHDRMTDKSRAIASITSDNSMALEFPYNGENRGTLTVRAAKEGGVDVMFSITKGQTMCRSYEYSCVINVRFDDSPTIRFLGIGPSDLSTETAFLNQPQRFLIEAKKAKRIRVSMEIFKSGSQLLEFTPPTPLVWDTKQ